MFKQFFAGMEFTALPIFALWLFIAIFLLMALRTFVFKSVRDFEPQSLMPLNDGNAVREVKP
jgi:cytochrome c oxidase cbb3-type subunit IV